MRRSFVLARSMTSSPRPLITARSSQRLKPAASFLPYMIPFSITIEEAAAPHSSLRFLFWGAGLVVFPLTLAYTAAVYFIFRGKVRGAGEYAE